MSSLPAGVTKRNNVEFSGVYILVFGLGIFKVSNTGVKFCFVRNVPRDKV